MQRALAWSGAALLGLVAMVASCGGSSSSPSPSCVEGEQKACVCYDGQPGYQLCQSGGQKYGDCVCVDPDGGVAGTAGSGGTGAGGSGGTGTGGTAGTGAGGTAGTGTGGTAGTGGTGTGGTGGTSCAAEMIQAEPVPRGMLVLLDRSASMMDMGKWDAARDGLLAFAGLPVTNGLHIGVLTFPVPPSTPATIPTTCTIDADCGQYGPCLPGFNQCAGSFAANTSCEPADYATPAVPFALMPGAFAAIHSDVMALTADGEATPTTPMLKGAVGYAAAYKPSPDIIMDLVLVTDGEPTGCSPNDITSVTAEVSAALGSSIRTFVISIGADPGTAEQIAAAGGTIPAVIVNPGGSAAQDVRSGFETAYQTPCALRPPDTGGATIDWNKVNIVTRSAGQPDTVVYYVGNASGCSASNGGWYLDETSSPARAELCPMTCAYTRQNGVETWYQVGCNTVDQ